MASKGKIIAGLAIAGATLAVLSSGRDDSSGGSSTPNASPGPWLLDWRGRGDPDDLYPGIMDPIGVTLHQTGSSRSGDPERLTTTNAHFVVMRDGRVLWLHELNRRVENSKYKRHIQVEVEGNFQSARGRWWRGEDGDLPIHVMNPEQGVGLRQLLRWLEPQLSRNKDGKLEIGGHMMAATPIRRGNDPGPEVWTAGATYARSRGWTLAPIIGEGIAPPDAWWNYTPAPLPANA